MRSTHHPSSKSERDPDAQELTPSDGNPAPHDQSPVDGATYRWRLRGRPTHDQGLVRSPHTYAVEHAGTPGTTLVVTTNQPHPSNWFATQGNPILPAQVTDSIRAALHDGWTPASPSSPFHLDQSAGFVSSH
ncbi:hypothetical protein ACWGH5_16160 [Streptomyces sp. NPDC054864]